MINVEVHKTGNENSVSLLRRFTKKVQGSGVLPRVRGDRYSSRNISENVKKKKTLKKLKKRNEIMRQIKLGKITENAKRTKKR